MDVKSTEALIALIVLIALQALLSAARTAIINVRKARLKQLQEEGHATASLVERLAEDSTRFVSSTQIATTFIHLLAAMLATLTFSDHLARSLQGITWLAPASGWLAVLVIIFLLGLFMLIFGELWPSLIALQHSERVSLALARPMAFLGVLTWPLIRFVVGTSRRLAGLSGDPQEATLPIITEEEIKTMVDAGQEEGVIEQDEKAMIYSIFEFGDTLAREVMVPRIDIVAVDDDTPMLEALDVIMEAGHSRIPVYRDSIDNIVGILYAKDLLPHLSRGETTVPLETMVREPYFIPETKKADQLLADLQLRKIHMCVVVDEYGGTAGLVTIEDLLEEIVGEIQDEYDSEEPIYEIISEDEYVLSARINLDDLSKLVGEELPDEGSDTLGGLIYNYLGRVPAVGDVVPYDGLRITIMSVIGRRIDKVRVTRAEPRSPAEAPPAPSLADAPQPQSPELASGREM